MQKNIKPSGNGITELMKAASKGDLRLVTALADSGADINAADVFGNSALIYAVNAGALATVEFLLAQGAAVCHTKPNGMSALSIAAGNGDEKLIAPLLMAHFFTAARLGLTDDLIICLEEGAEVNARSQQDWTALMIAAVNGHLETVRVLLRHGADPLARDARGRTARTLALVKGQSDVALFLEQYRKGASSHLTGLSSNVA